MTSLCRFLFAVVLDERTTVSLILLRAVGALLGMQLLRGRLFTEQDSPDVDGVVIVDGEFGQRHWPGEDPVGRRIRLEGGSGQYLIVVGVVACVKLGSLSEQGGFVWAYVPAPAASRNPRFGRAEKQAYSGGFGRRDPGAGAQSGCGAAHPQFCVRSGKFATTRWPGSDLT